MNEYNYFRSFTVSDTTFPTNPQVDFTFHAEGFSLINRGSTVIEYSFDGTNTHGDLNPSDSSVSMQYANRPVSKIWFRASSNSVIRVEGWRQ